MTETRNSKIVIYQKGLDSKEDYGTVNRINEKAELGDSAFVKKPVKSESTEPGRCINDTYILPQAPNLHKHKELHVHDEGYIKLPRSILRSEEWKSLTHRRKGLFLYILEKLQFRSKIYNFHGKDLLIAPGQYCVTYRRLVDEYNQTIKFKNERIDVPFLQRAVSVFDGCGWSDTRSDTGIMIITITHPELSDHFKSISDTQNDTLSIQDRYTNEERKKEKNIKETIDRAIAPDRSSLFQKEKKEEKSHESNPSPQRKKSKLTEDQKKVATEVWQMLQNLQMVNVPNSVVKGVTQGDVTSWVKNFTLEDIRESIKMAFDASGVKSYPAYIQKLLSAKIVQKGKDSNAGKKYVESIVKSYNLKHIELKQDYFTDLISTEQTMYFLPQTTLESILKKSIQRAKDQEGECYE